MARHRSETPPVRPTAPRRGTHRRQAPPTPPWARAALGVVAVGAVSATGNAVEPGPARSSPEASTPVGLAGAASPESLLRQGSEGREVRQLQRVLNAWYPGRVALAEDGVYGPRTEAAVRHLQERANLTVDGIVGPRTRATLDMPASGTASTPPQERTQKPRERTPEPEQRTPERSEASPAGIVMPTTGTVTSGFGARWGSKHNGMDIANQIGTPIVSTASGVVAESGPASGFGMWVRVEHDDGTTSVYGHINRSLVRAGQRVAAGEPIATMGNRGRSTGPHLHFEIWRPDGTKIDPEGWLAKHDIRV